MIICLLFKVQRLIDDKQIQSSGLHGMVLLGQQHTHFCPETQQHEIGLGANYAGLKVHGA